MSRWDNLTRQFRLSIYLLNTLPTEPLLYLSLYAGLETNPIGKSERPARTAGLETNPIGKSEGPARTAGLDWNVSWS
jgi:hypothetical protein